MVAHVIQTAAQHRGVTVAFREVVASRGKVVRAEPIAQLYEQGRVSHIGELSALEDQMCQFTNDGYVGDGSPDRADALVWALSSLMDMRPVVTVSPEVLARSRQPAVAYGSSRFGRP